MWGRWEDKTDGDTSVWNRWTDRQAERTRRDEARRWARHRLGKRDKREKRKRENTLSLVTGNRKAKWQHAKRGKKQNAFSGLLATKIHFRESQKTTKRTFQLYANLSNPLFASILREKKSKSFSAPSLFLKKHKPLNSKKGNSFWIHYRKHFTAHPNFSIIDIFEISYLPHFSQREPTFLHRNWWALHCILYGEGAFYRRTFLLQDLPRCCHAEWEKAEPSLQLQGNRVTLILTLGRVWVGASTGRQRPEDA